MLKEGALFALVCAELHSIHDVGVSEGLACSLETHALMLLGSSMYLVTPVPPPGATSCLLRAVGIFTGLQ